MNVLVLFLSFFQNIQMVLPEGNGAWAVQMVSSGGIAGRTTTGNITINSEAKIACLTPAMCPKEVKLSDVQPLVEAIQAATLPVPPPPPNPGLCNDCIRRVLTIRWRDSVGVLHTYIAAWDETTRNQIPLEVIRLHDAILALK